MRIIGTKIVITKVIIDRKRLKMSANSVNDFAIIIKLITALVVKTRKFVSMKAMKPFQKN